MEETKIEVLKKTELCGQQFNVYGTIAEPLFKAKDVALMIGLTNQRDFITRVDDDERCKLNLPRQGETWMLTENGLYEVLMQSRKPIAKQFKKGVKTILKEIRKTGTYTAEPTPQNSQIADKVYAAKFLAEFLNLNDAGKLMMAKAIADPLGLPTPDYVPSKGAHLSAKELLAKHNASISVQKFNDALVKLGYLATMERKASGGKTKHFKVVTEKGQQYGENMVSPQNPNQTQPHWYTDTFNTLLEQAKACLTDNN